MSSFGQKPLLDVLNGALLEVPPMWLMRQAGRYLPEYRALRAEKGGFLELAYDSDCACEITLQPIRRFGFDGAILFSDILVIPHAMGQDLWFEAGEGPRLAPKLSESNWHDLVSQPQRLDPIYETVRKVKAALPATTTFLGFAGSPWTVATYMVSGQGSKDHADARTMAYTQPEEFGALIDAIAQHTVEYLSKQIEAGVDAVQLFDSWSGSLSPAQFDRWVIAPNAAIVSALKTLHPDTPVIGFPKGAGAKLLDYAKGVGADAIGIDETIDPVWAHANLPEGLPVQGNLDPMALLAGGEPLEQAVHRIRTAFAGRPHVFNLGHGISQFTPIAHVEKLISLVRNG
jgi:uroporphyrinogen decarboxylase